MRLLRRVSATPPISNPTLVRRRPALDFSVTGFVYCTLMAFMGFAAVNSQANLLFGVFGLMIGILLISGVISRLVLKKLRVERRLPPHGIVGEPMTVLYLINNGKRFWPSLSVSVAELEGGEAFTRQAQCYMLHAAPRMTASVPAEMVAKRRGLHEFEQIQLATSFPFGFIKRAIIRKQKDRLWVLPALGQVDGRLLEMCRSATMGGGAVRPRPGGADEFYGLKEFRPGDNPHHIYWRRSARTGVLVSREMTRVAPPRILLLVDTYLPDPSPDDVALVERTIAMAASLGSTALEDGLSVGVCAWSEGELSLPPSRGKQQRDELLTLVASLGPNARHSSAELLKCSHGLAKADTTLILFTPRPLEISASERKRGHLLVFCAAIIDHREQFRFRREVDFKTCNPVHTKSLGFRVPNPRSTRHHRADSTTPTMIDQ